MTSTISPLSASAPGRTAAHSPLLSQPLRVALWALLLVAFSTRLSPLADIDGRLYWQWISEDGYLMQTIARNMAIGLGMSTAEGTIATNGVQPLATFVFAALHALAGGSKLGGIALVVLLSTAVAAAAAYVAWKVGTRVLAPLPHGRELALAAALLWFAAPPIAGHSMNALETGIYYLAILCTLAYYLRITADPDRPLDLRQRIALGALLGVSFLARNDAVFFIAGLLLAHVLIGGSAAGGGYGRRIVDAIVAGLVSLVVAMPWLINNYLLFGTIVPISGIAQSHSAALGHNLLRLPAILFESAYLYVPIPRRFESMGLVALVSGGFVFASLAGFWWFAARLSITSRRFFVTGLVFLAGVSCYYGLFFGAPHFLGRYTSPLSIFLLLGTAVTAVAVMQVLLRSPQRVRVVLMVLVPLLALESALFAARTFASGTWHMHKQVVEWVNTHVPESAWVGAVQTGTLGYFHDRTINLDGKVNPAALRARMDDGHVLNYVVDSKIDFLADWIGIAGWAELTRAPRFMQEFELVVKDEKRNLGVLRRTQPREGQPVAQ